MADEKTIDLSKYAGTRGGYLLLDDRLPAGCWLIGGDLRIYVKTAPTWWQAWWSRRLLGWKWVPA
jgi:hypothetical protein